MYPSVMSAIVPAEPIIANGHSDRDLIPMGIASTHPTAVYCVGKITSSSDRDCHAARGAGKSSSNHTRCRTKYFPNMILLMSSFNAATSSFGGLVSPSMEGKPLAQFAGGCRYLECARFRRGPTKWCVSRGGFLTLVCSTESLRACNSASSGLLLCCCLRAVLLAPVVIVPLVFACRCGSSSRSATVSKVLSGICASVRVRHVFHNWLADGPRPTPRLHFVRYPSACLIRSVAVRRWHAAHCGSWCASTCV
jgi:hypothetical protein